MFVASQTREIETSEIRDGLSSSGLRPSGTLDNRYNIQIIPFDSVQWLSKRFGYPFVDQLVNFLYPTSDDKPCMRRY